MFEAASEFRGGGGCDRWLRENPKWSMFSDLPQVAGCCCISLHFTTSVPHTSPELRTELTVNTEDDVGRNKY